MRQIHFRVGGFAWGIFVFSPSAPQVRCGNHHMLVRAGNRCGLGARSAFIPFSHDCSNKTAAVGTGVAAHLPEQRRHEGCHDRVGARRAEETQLRAGWIC